MKLKSLKPVHYFFIALFIIVVMALVQFSWGRTPICKCGYVKLWHGEKVSSENSQHITDWYTFSHIIHGFGFYFLTWLIDRKKKIPFGLKLLMAIMLEVSWELIENSDMVINRYRTATIALDYFGDSIINSVSDVCAMISGFWLASKLKVKYTLFLVIIMEIGVGIIIRDNLTLNIIMLIHPIKAIKTWQAAGG